MVAGLCVTWLLGQRVGCYVSDKDGDGDLNDDFNNGDENYEYDDDD